MEYLALYMFLTFAVLILIGYPVAFTLAATAFGFGIYAFGLGFFNLLPLRIYGVMTSFTLIALPLFIFMGMVLDRSGLAESLLETMGLVFGGLRGGIALSVVVVGTLLAASTGVVGASVTTMGLIALPTMLRRGYLPQLATGSICASGTLGQIVPPSIVLIIVGDVLGVSVADLFLGAFIPGLLLAGCYIVFIAAVAVLRPDAAPAIPREERATISTGELTRRVVRVLIPPFALIFAVLGSIFFGIASPTEAAGVGAAGAVLLAIINRRFSLRVLVGSARATLVLTSMILIILVGATAFGLAFRGMGGAELIRNFIADIGLDPWAVFAIAVIVIFLLGFFLDFIEISFVILPIIGPILIGLGFEPMWFGILFGVIMQTSFLTPPFGYALFYLRGVAPPSVTTMQIYRGVVPFVVIQLIMVILLIAFPALVTWLPALVFR